MNTDLPLTFRVLTMLVMSLCGMSAYADACDLPATPQSHPAIASAADDAAGYRVDAARHVYDSYPQCVLQGRLPAVVHAVLLVELTVGKDGQLRAVRVLRAPPEMPNAAEVVRDMLLRVTPFPAAVAGGSDAVTFNEVWMFDENGRFQLGALTEGPR
jgi:protein TonB